MSKLLTTLALLSTVLVAGCTGKTAGGQEGDAGGEDLREFLLGQGYTEIPMTRLATGHYAITGSAAEVTLDLIVDTGSSHSLLDLERVERFGIETENQGSRATALDYSNQAVETGHLEEVAVAGFNFGTLRVTVIDLSQVNRVLQGLGEPRVDGILGSDALLSRNAVIDYTGPTLYLKD